MGIILLSFFYKKYKIKSFYRYIECLMLQMVTIKAVLEKYGINKKILLTI